MIDILKELNLDFTNMKLPLEPKQIILMYLAFKLINNLDRIDFNSILSGKNINPKLPQLYRLNHMNNIKGNNFNGIFIFFIIIILYLIYNIVNTCLKNIDITLEKIEIPQKNLQKCPLFTDKNLQN